MGLDGFSMSNLGLSRNLSSAQLAQNAEATARESLDSQIADVDGVGKKEKVGREDPDAAFNGHIPFIPDKKEGEQEEQENQEEQEQVGLEVEHDEDEEDEDSSKYSFRYNANDMIEIWDTKTKTILKTISPEDAQKSLLTLSKMPGIFINKAI